MTKVLNNVKTNDTVKENIITVKENIIIEEKNLILAENGEEFMMNHVDPIDIRHPQLLPALTLAYIGDGYYELQVRNFLLAQGRLKVDELHKTAISLVRAGTQAQMAHRVMEQLTEYEVGVLHRGRNAKGQHVPKGASVSEYRNATGLEALVGYWFLMKMQDRLDWFFDELWIYAKEEGKC